MSEPRYRGESWQASILRADLEAAAARRAEAERAEAERAEEIFMDAVAAQTTAPAASSSAGVVEVTGG